MFLFDGASERKREPLYLPLEGPPPGPKPNHPTLLLALPIFISEDLQQVLINDLVYSRTSTLISSSQPFLADSAWLQILDYLPGSDLLTLTRTFGGSIVVGDNEVFEPESAQVNTAIIQEVSRKGPFQAVIVDDTCFYHEPDIRNFVLEQYHQHAASVVYLALEGIFDLTPLNQAMGVDWRVTAYTKRANKLTAAGERIVGWAAFPFHDRYTKASYVVGGGAEEELFCEYINPDDYDLEEDEIIPDPSPGSPVLTHIADGQKSVSYYSFVNPLDVSRGAIVLRLCYAAFSRAAGES